MTQGGEREEIKRDRCKRKPLHIEKALRASDLHAMRLRVVVFDIGTMPSGDKQECSQ